MSTEIQARFEESTKAQNIAPKSISSFVEEMTRPKSALLFKPELKAEAKGEIGALPQCTIDFSADSAPKKTPPKEFTPTDKIPSQDLTPEQKKLGDALTEALERRDTKAIDQLIKANAEWPKNLGLAVEYANAHFDQNNSGMVIAYRYAERNTTPRLNADDDDDDIEPITTKSESGYIAYNFATWEDKVNADGKRSGMRIPAKFGGGRVRTSAYRADSDDITQPIGLNSEDVNGVDSFVFQG